MLKKIVKDWRSFFYIVNYIIRNLYTNFKTNVKEHMRKMVFH